MEQQQYELSKIKAIVGLGNPGTRFERTRHNIGFRVVDAIAEKFDVTFKEQGDLAHTEIMLTPFSADPLSENPPLPQKIILLKPLTFMNTSGRAMSFLTKKGIEPQEMVVVHDELEKGFGKMMIRLGGSARGHNGLRSIIGTIGADFWRLRFGIGRPERKEDVGNFVLTRFTPQEEGQMSELLSDAMSLLGL